MKDNEKRDCLFEEHRYSHGEEFCRSGKCYRCDDGKLEERSDDFPPFSFGP